MKQVTVLLAFLAFTCPIPTAHADIEARPAVEVDLQLVLAADTSGSMGRSLAKAQRLGFAAAFRDPALQSAVASGPLGRVAVVYFEWSDRHDQEVVVPWTVLSAPDDMIRFAVALEAAETDNNSGETSISGAMLFAHRLLAESGFRSFRKVVDISGNGRNSEGPGTAVGLRLLRSGHVTVNGLVLPPANPDGPYDALFTGYDGPLVDYYRQEVINGPGAFAIEVDPAEGFGGAILRKLVLEIAWAEPGGKKRWTN